MISNFDSMYIIRIEGWVNFNFFWGGVSLKFQGGVKKRQSPDFRSPEVGISAVSMY